ncbi:MAG: hypothetical protein WKH64_15970 [Chloroflexia bacterium]
MKVVFPSRGRNPREETPRTGVGYVWVQHLPLKLALRERPELEDRPVILGGGVRKAATDGLVVDASDECLEAGVRVGQPLREAREYIPGASLLPANPSADSRAHEALLDLVGASRRM